MNTPASNARMALRRLLRRPLFHEPLLYFVLVGSAAFAIHRAARSDDRVIRITSSVRGEIARSL